MNLRKLLKRVKGHPAYLACGAYFTGFIILVGLITAVFPVFGIPSWITRAVIIVLVLGFLVVAGWAWIHETRSIKLQSSRRKAVTRRISFAAFVILLAAGIAWSATRPFKFARNTTGIVVLGISGDDDNDSFQREWVATLNAALARDPAASGIEVVRLKERIDEQLGVLQAHGRARRIGAQRNALLVVWGEKTAADHFFPRITIVQQNRDLQITGNRTLGVQIIEDIDLPAALIGQPLYLTHFVAGYWHYSQHRFADALRNFEAALRAGEADREEKADLLFFAGTTRFDVSVGRKEMSNQLTQATKELSDAIEVFRAGNRPAKLARALNNLGNTYGELPTVGRDETLRRAITCYEDALSIFTREAYPAQWAQTQNNLGTVYHDLSGDKSTNLGKEIMAYEASLQVYTKNRYPYEWARTQNNLGTAYTDLMPTGDANDNFGRAMKCYESALRVYTERRYPKEWAQTQNNIGVAYYRSSVGKQNDNLTKAISAFEAALRVRNETDSPRDWAATQNSLGGVYATLEAGDQKENTRKAIEALQAALRVRTEEAFPYDWAQAQTNLGIAYGKLAIMGDAESFGRAVDAYHASLRIHTEAADPIEWGLVQNNLGVLYKDVSTGDRRRNLQTAMQYFENALRAFPEQELPEYHAAVMQNISEANELIKKLN